MPRVARPDILGHAVAEFLSKDLKQSIVVENKPGAQGAIGAEMVARSDADGYTLFVASGSIVMLNPILYKKLPYDAIKDFRMLSLITQVPVIMEVDAGIPVKTVAEFVDYAKIPARSITDRRASAARCISPPRCSSMRRASK